MALRRHMCSYMNSNASAHGLHLFLKWDSTSTYCANSAKLYYKLYFKMCLGPKSERICHTSEITFSPSSQLQCQSAFTMAVHVCLKDENGHWHQLWIIIGTFTKVPETSPNDRSDWPTCLAFAPAPAAANQNSGPRCSSVRIGIVHHNVVQKKTHTLLKRAQRIVCA